jgi:hypothetical protein
MDPLTDSAVINAMRLAWRDSCADDSADRHEEGGYIVRDADGSLGVLRCPRGGRFRITPPPLDSAGRYNDMELVAAFHTHPNPTRDEQGRVWSQAPSESDRRWHARRRVRGLRYQSITCV